MLDTIDETRKSIGLLSAALKGNGACTDTEVFSIIDTLLQLFDIAEAVDQQRQILTPDEISDIGEQGLTLIDNLLYKLLSQHLDSHLHDVAQVALVVAQWVIAHHGSLSNIQSVVDELAYLGNGFQEKALLSQLVVFMTQVVNACNDVIKHDLDNADPARPWRILNINRGIVATRSHDFVLMNAVFTELIQAIPMDAPAFFKEGMSEMVRQNYPQPVREVMQAFYEQTKLPAVH